jgi:uncharacterized membrane protein
MNGRGMNIRFGLLSLMLAVGLQGCGSSSGSSNSKPGGPDPTSGYTSLELLPLAEADASAALGINIEPELLTFVVGTSGQGESVSAVYWEVDPVAKSVSAAFPLPTEGSIYSAAFGVNNAGTMVGELEKGSARIPVVWPADGSAPAELSRTIGTTDYPSGVVRSINSAGVMVGEIRSADSSMAVLWRDVGEMPTRLPLLPRGGRSSAHYICDIDCIAGGAENEEGFLRATLWSSEDNTYLVNLGVLPGHQWSVAWGVDVAGHVVGESVRPDGVAHAVIWKRGPRGDYTAVDLGNDACARAINDYDHVAGRSGTEAAIWDATGRVHKILEAGTAGEAFGMNNAGTVVGNSGPRGFVALPNKVD